MASPDGFYLPCDMKSRAVIVIEDDEICRQVAERMLARGARVIDRPPEAHGDQLRIDLPG